MSRTKITVDNYVSISSAVNDKASHCIDLSLVIHINPEFEDDFDVDLSYLLTGLAGSDYKKRRKELLCFVEYARNMRGSETSKSTRIYCFQRWVRLTNIANPSASIESEDVVKAVQKHFQSELNTRKIGAVTYGGLRKQFRVILRDCFLLPEGDFDRWFPKLIPREGKLKGATINASNSKAKAFSDSDFRLVIAMLLNYAKDFQRRYISRLGVEDLRVNQPTFKYNNGVHILNTAKILVLDDETVGSFNVNRSTIFYMLIFISITGANLSPLMRARRKDVTLTKGERDLLIILITDKRKKKKEEPKPYLMKKYQEKLFKEIIEHSTLVDSREDALLFPNVQVDGSFKTFSSGLVNSAIKTFRTSGPIGEFGEVLHPNAIKLRDTHGQQFDDLITRSAALGNSIRVAARHYSDGNPDVNTDELQSGMNSYTLSLLSGEDLSKIEEHFKPDIDIKMVDSEAGRGILKKLYATKTITGGICQNAKDSPEANKHKRKLTRLNLIKEDEFLCNNILACFTCPNHIFVHDEDFVYILLSFYVFLSDSLYSHESGGLFGSKDLVNKAIDEIDWMKRNKISADIVIKAERRIKYSGVHPLWSTGFMED